jgi:hypothetical protein
MGLIRKALIVGAILVALPSPPAPQGDGAQPSLPSYTFAALAAAADTVADFKGFCERRPQACATGQYLTGLVEGKLRNGARMAYQWANPQPTGQNTQQASALPLPPAPGKADSKSRPSLRLATMNDTKPKSIEDLLHGTSE